MPTATSPKPRLPKQDRQERVLDTAQRLFYGRGVHEVGMDELVRESGLAKASVYRLYPTKDALVEGYLSRLATTILEEIDGLEQAQPRNPRRVLLAVLDAIEQDLRRPGFRGCAFNNASIEFDDPQHPARVVARSYREELAARFVRLSQQLTTQRRGQVLGRRIAVLVDGAYTNAAHLGWDGPASTGMQLARQLVREAGR